MLHVKAIAGDPTRLVMADVSSSLVISSLDIRESHRFHLLRRAGDNIREAGDGRRGLEAATERAPDPGVA